LKLGAIRLINAARINPKVSQSIASALISAELDLAIAEFVSACTIDKVFVAHFFCTPGVGKYRIWRWRIVADKVSG
jgi:membrane protein YdbS with pleckstrin-like domain